MAKSLIIIVELLGEARAMKVCRLDSVSLLAGFVDNRDLYRRISREPDYC